MKFFSKRTMYAVLVAVFIAGCCGDIIDTPFDIMATNEYKQLAKQTYIANSKSKVESKAESKALAQSKEASKDTKIATKALDSKESKSTKVAESSPRQSIAKPSQAPTQPQPKKISAVDRAQENLVIKESGGVYRADISYKPGTNIKHGEEVLYYQNGKVAQKANYSDGKKDGLYQIFSQKGVLIYEAWYRNGLLDGKSKLFNVTNGNIKSEMNFNNGVQEGQMQIYSPSGKLWHKITYAQGKKEGKAYEYNELGEVVREMTYRNDREVR